MYANRHYLRLCSASEAPFKHRACIIGDVFIDPSAEVGVAVYVACKLL